MKDNPWIGYFPIPNNRNRERLMWNIGDNKKYLSEYRKNCVRKILLNIPEMYLHEAFVNCCNDDYFYLVWKTEEDSFYSIESRLPIEALPKFDEYNFLFHKHTRQSRNIIMMTCLASTESKGFIEQFLQEVNKELEKHYGK